MRDTAYFNPAPTMLSTDPDTTVVLAADSYSRIYRRDGESFHHIQHTAEELTSNLGLRELSMDIPELKPDSKIHLTYDKDSPGYEELRTERYRRHR